MCAARTLYFFAAAPPIATGEVSKGTGVATTLPAGEIVAPGGADAAGGLGIGHKKTRQWELSRFWCWPWRRCTVWSVGWNRVGDCGEESYNCRRPETALIAPDRPAWS